jgi:glucose-6-phosphate dehydrogenase assembly protein OpcA
MSLEEMAHDPFEVSGPTEVRWRGSAHGLAEIEQVLARIWADPDLQAAAIGRDDRRVAARTSVLNLVVLAPRPELAERSAATVARMTGRHPSRTILVAEADPEGPSELVANIEVHCAMPRRDMPETWTELIYLRAGGEGGRHVASYVAPLLVHDLPVAMWWPGNAPLGASHANELLGLADRLVVDGASWSGNGLDRLARLAALAGRADLAVFDFALVRQARWREAIASVFDDRDLRPTLDRIETIDVLYSSHDPSRDPGLTNLVRPVYHVAWLASRLDMTVDRPLAAVVGDPRHAGGPDAVLREGGHAVEARLVPVDSSLPPGTTVAVRMGARSRHERLLANVTAEEDTVRVRIDVGGREIRDRRFRARRRTEIELLSEAVEWGGRDPVTEDALRKAGELVGQVDGR